MVIEVFQTLSEAAGPGVLRNIGFTLIGFVFGVVVGAVGLASLINEHVSKRINDAFKYFSSRFDQSLPKRGAEHEKFSHSYSVQERRRSLRLVEQEDDNEKRA